MSITRVIGTAGHIDHGKTALVRALTGVDTDRLKEEKERRISIDLGFAPLNLPGGVRAGVVDVPGHERFVKNMLAGVGGIDAVLFTVAADEGVMPQTVEHLEILHYLDVRAGLVALTKKDLVDEEMLELVREEVEEAFHGTALEDAPILAVSSVTGEGVAELAERLAAILREAPERPAPDWFRLPVDRVFSSRGFGTVVTGTVWSGTVRVGDRLDLLPSGKEVRVRKVEVFSEEVEEARAGQRSALALHGVSREEVARGDTLAAPGVLTPTHMVDGRVRLSEQGRGLRHRQRVRFHHGAAEVLGRVALIEKEDLDAGGAGLIQLRLESPVVLTRGDRFILRTYSPARTLGGGTVLDPSPTKHRRSRKEEDLAFLRVAESGDRSEMVRALLAAGPRAAATPAEIAARLQIPEEEVREALRPLEEREEARSVAGMVVLAGVLDELAAEAEERVRDAGSGGGLKAGIPREEVRKNLSRRVEIPLFQIILDRLVERKKVSLRGDSLFPGGGELPERVEREARRLEALLDESGAAPPSPADLAGRLGLDTKHFTALVDSLVRVDRVRRVASNLIYRTAEIDRLREAAVRLLRERGSMGVTDFKDETGLSRKFAVPLLELFDQERITRREGDRRVPGSAFPAEKEEEGG
ncbi:MAG: selenocysteine-specific translation elongation factor [Candidatus Eisenbacteria bacterium]|nr:selenocysteine-specific translation elongation factor [Candidatus Eisenbacteria bacterium]